MIESSAECPVCSEGQSCIIILGKKVPAVLGAAVGKLQTKRVFWGLRISHFWPKFVLTSDICLKK